MPNFNRNSYDLSAILTEELQTLSDERETLVSNTHLLQGLIEQAHKLTRASLSAAPSAIETLRTQIISFESEMSMIMAELYATQEALEQQILRQKKMELHAITASQRIDNLVAKLPGHWEAETIEKIESEDSKSTTVSWRLTNVYIGGEHLTDIEFSTVMENSRVHLIIKRHQRAITGDKAASKGVTTYAQTENEIIIAPESGSPYDGLNAVISRLSTSDWSLVLALLGKLSAYVTAHTASTPALYRRIDFQDGIRRLKDSVNMWPTTFRFDTASVAECPPRAHYRGLSIKISNIEVGDLVWPKVSFILATVDEQSADFGSNPRLEFPKPPAKQGLESWYAETTDEQGTRLELRFAGIRNMDLQVWTRLSGNDQILIAGLISSMSRILSDCALNVFKTAENKAAWIRLAEAMRINFTGNIRLLSQNSNKVISKNEGHRGL
jgi:hypothetical protein